MIKITKKSDQRCAKKIAQLPISSEKQLKILRVLNDYKDGIQMKILSEISGYPRRNLYNILYKFKEHGIVEKDGYFWKLCNIQGDPLKLHSCHSLLTKDYSIQAHNISFILKLVDKPFWWEKRHNYLLKLKEIQFKKSVSWGNNPYEMLKKGNFLIQVFATSIVFFNRKRYYGQDAYSCFIQALEDTLDLYDWLERRLNFKFFKEGTPQFQVRTHHYVKLRDIIAEKCKKAHHGFEITINGHLRAWVDMSEPLGFETGHKDYGVEDMSEYHRHVKDILSNSPPTNSELLKEIKEFKLDQDKVNVKFAKTLGFPIDANENPRTKSKYIKDSYIG